MSDMDKLSGDAGRVDAGTVIDGRIIPNPNDEGSILHPDADPLFPGKDQQPVSESEVGLMDLNHSQWLETVPIELLSFVDKAVKDWNDQADEFNLWSALRWDERDELLRKAAGL